MTQPDLDAYKGLLRDATRVHEEATADRHARGDFLPHEVAEREAWEREHGRPANVLGGQSPPEPEKPRPAPKAEQKPKAKRPEAVATPASQVEREEVDWLEPGRIPCGHITGLVGHPGLGKSMYTCDLAARVSRGDLGEPANVLMLSAEDSLAATVRPRLEAAQADLDRVRFVRMEHGDGLDSDLSFPSDLNELRRLVAELRPKLVVIDPLVSHLDDAVDSHRDHNVRKALAPLRAIADEFGCAVVALMHLNKDTSVDALLRIGGSVGFGALARSVLLLARDPDDEEGETGS